MARESFEVPVVPATRDNTAKYGVFIGTDVPVAGLGIPFYQGAVESRGDVYKIAVANRLGRAVRVTP